MTREDLKMVSDLMERGFTVNGDYMEFVSGSACNCIECRILILKPVYCDVTERYYYRVRYESFSEGGEVFTEHHIVEEKYIGADNLADFLRSKGIRTRTEREERRRERRRI